MDVSYLAQGVISFTPIVGIVMGAVCVFFFMLWHHREVKMQIKTGTYVPHEVDYKAVALLSGLLLTGIGFIMSVIFAIMAGFSYILLGGLIPFVTGLCILLFYKLYKPFHKDADK